MQEWQELIGALITATATIVIAVIAVFGDTLRAKINKNNNQRHFVKKASYLNELIEDYKGALLKARDGIDNFSVAAGNSTFFVRIPFPPDADRYIGDYAHIYEKALDDHLIDFQLSALELERVLERNGVSLILKMDPTKREISEAELTDRSELPTINSRLGNSIDATESLHGSLRKQIEKLSTD